MLIFSLFYLSFAYTQNISYYKSKIIYTDSVIKKFDTIVVNPLNFKIYVSDTLIEKKHYKLYPLTATIEIDSSLINKKLTLIYSPWHFSTFPEYFSKDIKLIILDTAKKFQREKYYIPKTDYYFKETLIQRGSISRGISIGTNQNATFNSSMNIQLSGNLGGGFQINAALTDNQMPIQPMGNTAQLNEFDKIFINVFNNNHSFTFGDYDIFSNYEYMSINRKAQGVKYVYSNKERDRKLAIESNNSISKGRYNRMIFNGIEGIQGPYRLKGLNNEPYIVILAGTERVYVDNKLLKRGEDNDYIINYNTAELYFTAKVPITHESRIVVEFEYSERNYLRFLTYNSLKYQTEKIKNDITIYFESDAKNQPIQYSLSDSNKIILSHAGDSISKAAIPFWSYDTSKIENNIYYKLIDTVVNNTKYKVFIFSTDTSAKYRVYFTFTGKYKGNYILDKNTINGKVYKWVAPVNNIPQGEYEPVRLLALPERKFILSNKFEHNFKYKNTFLLEIALSDHDKNLFSKINDNDNKGFLVRTGLKLSLTDFNDSLKNIHIENYVTFINKNFSPIEKLRYVEFNRDWNYSLFKINNEITGNHQINLKTEKTILITGLNYVLNINEYQGFMPFINYNFKNRFFKTVNKISYLITKQNNVNTSFLNLTSNTEQTIKPITAGCSFLIENNKWKRDTFLLSSSFRNIRMSGYLRNSDTMNYKIMSGYERRYNYISDSINFKKSFVSNDFFIEALIKRKSFLYNSNIIYRTLMPYISGNESKTKSITSNNYINFQLLKKFLLLSLNHQASAQLEAKQTYQYIEVAPGKGSYTWIDYNQNNIKELNEFEIARYPDQANYMKIVNPIPEYFKVYNTRLMQNIIIRPANILSNKSNLSEFISYFNDQFTMQTDVKTNSEKLMYKLIPLYFSHDTSLLYANYNIRNFLNFEYTPLNSSLRYLYQTQQNNNLLHIGKQFTKSNIQTLILTINIGTKIISNIEGGVENKLSYSENFIDKNYSIKSNLLRSNILLQITNNIRAIPEIKLSKRTEKNNNIILKAIENNIEIQKNLKNDMHINVKYSLIINNISKITNNSLMYELLNGLNAGRNHIFNIKVFCNLTTTLQLSLTYQYRKNEINKGIHYGNIEVRAYF